MIKEFIPCIYLKEGKAITSFTDETIVSEDPVELSVYYNDMGCDKLIVFDLSKTDEQHETAIDIIKEICSESDAPVIGAGNVFRMEDIKKILYAGCKAAALNFSKEGNRDILEEVSLKFGKDKIAISYLAEDNISAYEKNICEFSSLLIMINADSTYDNSFEKLPNIICLSDMDSNEFPDILSEDKICAVSGPSMNRAADKILDIRKKCSQNGLDVFALKPSFKWSDFKLGIDGLVPVVIQDYRNDQVLMVAYMNEAAYINTIETGRMTYYSRSRKEQWVKGETSGHFQYVKSLTADCDLDTILAKVKQVGPACHTGSRSCFFNSIAAKKYNEKNPQKVLDNVYSVICDRKENPREGSYTNYLFDKGIDKILKKCGEECTEIVIAAKNPNPNEVVYEMSDFLYHMMVLMAEKNVSWEQVTDELSRR